MKKLLPILLSFSIGAAIAQSIVITNYSGDTLNSGTYTVQGDEMDADTAKLITLMSSTIGQDQDVSVTKINLNKCNGTDNYFCWQQCYTSAITDMSPFLAPDKINMTPGTSDSSFSAYHLPAGQTGDADYRFVWRVKGESDSTYVDVKFKISGSCTTNSVNSKYVKNIKVYPNPTTNILNIENENSTNFKVEIINILGADVVNQTVVNNSKSAINTSNLKGGIYFVRVIEENQIVFSKKITINN